MALQAMNDEIELAVERVAAGGDGVAHADDGRVVFVTGALPGERVRARVIDQRTRYARAQVTGVLDASPARIAPPCPYVAAGCGGCGWQHVEPAAQVGLKRSIVIDALERLARIADPGVEVAPALATQGFRTTLRAAVRSGRAGFRRARSHDVVPVEHCLVAHPRLQELLADGRFPGASDVVLRCSAHTGERLAWATPSGPGLRVPDDTATGPTARVLERVAGRTWRISASSFFQSRPDGAEALVALVTAAAGEQAAATTPLVDAYSGVGLFAGALGTEREVVAVEQSSSATTDARHNLADLGATVVMSDVARWHPPAHLEPGLVVADPARQGLGAPAARLLASLGAPRLVLVSCDPAALGRDAGLLAEYGYRHRTSTLIDLFSHTPHIEAVSRFDRE